MAEGHSNAYLALHEQGYPLADSQQELVPFQRFVILEGLRKQQEEAEADQQKPQQSSGRASGGMNPLAEPNGGTTMSGESVTYVNKHEFEED